MNADSNKNYFVPLAILSGALVLALAANVGLWVRTNDLKAEIAKAHNGTAVEIAKLGAATESERAETRQQLESLAATVTNVNKTASTAVNRARVEAQKQDEQLHLRIDQQRQQLAGELTQMKDATSNVATRIVEVSTGVDSVRTDVVGVKTDVDGVKTQVATAQSALEQQASELKRMTGDMGVMSGLIATNAKDLDTLRALGERNYFEFTLAKAQKSRKIGEVTLTLKKADPKRNRYTVEVLADDKRVEKKDKTTNEPVQVYLAGNRQPHEIVINQVKKDEITGYLAAPKVTVSRR